MWVVLLIGWIKFPTRHDQSEALPRYAYWLVISMEFLRTFLRRHYAEKPVVASPNVGYFLRLITWQWGEHPVYQSESSIKESIIVLEFGFHAIDSGFQVCIPGFFVSGTWIPDCNHGLPDSLSYIPDSKAQNSGFHKQKSSGFRNPLHELNPWKYKQFSSVSSSKWLRSESTKMCLFEVNIPVTCYSEREPVNRSV